MIKSQLKQKKAVSLRNCRVMCTDFRGSYISARSSFSEQLTGDKLSSGDMLTNDNKFSSQAAEFTNSLH